MPWLAILDINLPHHAGLEVLWSLRAVPDLRAIPALMLTSSSSDQNMEEAYLLRANSYLVKPNDPESMVGLLNVIKSYWFTHNRPPDWISSGQGGKPSADSRLPGAPRMSFHFFR